MPDELKQAEELAAFVVNAPRKWSIPGVLLIAAGAICLAAGYVRPGIAMAVVGCVCTYMAARGLMKAKLLKAELENK